MRDLFCLLLSWPRNRAVELAPAYFNETLKREDVQERLRDNIFRAISVGQQVPSLSIPSLQAIEIAELSSRSVP